MDKWNGNERRDVDWREVTDHMAVTNQTLGRLVAHVEKQNGRIGKLENWRWFVMGCGVIIGIIVESIFKK